MFLINKTPFLYFLFETIPKLINAKIIKCVSEKLEMITII
jgi:hypothetical protein